MWREVIVSLSFFELYCIGAWLTFLIARYNAHHHNLRVAPSATKKASKQDNGEEYEESLQAGETQEDSLPEESEEDDIASDKLIKVAKPKKTAARGKEEKQTTSSDSKPKKPRKPKAPKKWCDDEVNSSYLPYC